MTRAASGNTERAASASRAPYPTGQGPIEQEQGAVDHIYLLLDADRAEANEALYQLRRQGTAGTPAAIAEREAFQSHAAERINRLRAVEDRLCFGRLDNNDGAYFHVGRVGLATSEGDRVLIDWRAPVAEPFYRATAATPGAVVRRRHIASSGRTVTGLDDEVLDLDAVASGRFGGTVEGEGALMVALGAARTGQMRDIVATIQSEQDEIIRAPLPGVLVVQGGPGTGKTVVALHRVAYLLYAHRDRIDKTGVLLIGPNATFLSYIAQVLPTLGETSVLTSTLKTMMPGVDGTAEEPPAAAATKGDARMAAVLARAVAARQRIPAGNRTLSVGGVRIMLTPGDVRQSISRARSTGKPHNAARVGFVTDLLDRLAGRLATATGADRSRATRQELLADLRASADVRREVNLCWMPLTPARVLADLLGSRERLAAAGRGRGGLTHQELVALYRPADSGWTEADVALLDELAELIGEDDSPTPAEQERQAAQEAEREYARIVVQGEGVLDADELAQRYGGPADERRSVSDSAGDRGWLYGHVVVDEAQELSPMQWRMVVRRCPTRSMTVVGDITQSSAPAGARSWERALQPHVEDRWQLRELTVNYRTPGRIMNAATAVLQAAGVPVKPARSAREGEFDPLIQQVTAADLHTVAAAVTARLEHFGEGQLAVIVPPNRRDLLVLANSRVSVLTPVQAKGLEFDVVIVVEPAAIAASSTRGINDLYVAMTRPTQFLQMLHTGQLPAGLEP